MTKFEAVGVDYQYSATNIDEATREFKKSCSRCINKGMHIECDRCAIANVYSIIKNILQGR